MSKSSTLPTNQTSEGEIAVLADHVTMSFNMANEELNNLKEYFIKLMKRELFFKEFVALDDVSFTVKKGDVYGIVGSNGSGKSTMLKIIAGVLEPTKGSCTINGSIAPLIELGAGFDLELTARENIYLNGALLGYSHGYIEQHFDEIVDFAELWDFLDLPMKNYSSGMVARIAFAIATIIVPNILIVDEALAVGDVFFQEKCERRINSLINDFSTTVLFVSHSIEQVERICKRAIWIEKGRKIMEGAVEDVCRAYRNMEYIDFTTTHKIMAHEDADSELTDPYEKLPVSELALALWHCSQSNDPSGEEAFTWLRANRHLLPPDTLKLCPLTADALASRELACILAHNFARARRPATDKINPTALGKFTDADRIDPAAREAFCWCVDHGLIDGKSDDEGALVLMPTAPIVRIDFAKLITKTFRDVLAYPDDVSPTEPFVRSGSFDHVVSHQLMSGYESGLFGPHDLTSRGQALTVLWRSAGETSPHRKPSFDDIPADSFFREPVAWAEEIGLLSQHGGSFHGDKPITIKEFEQYLDGFEGYFGMKGLGSQVHALIDRSKPATCDTKRHAQATRAAKQESKDRSAQSDELSRAQLAEVVTLITKHFDTSASLPTSHT